MQRRMFLKLAAGVWAMAMCSWKGSAVADETTRSVGPLASGPQTRVFIAGVGRGASDEVIKSAVRAAAEASTDFRWLSKGDAVFIKPALNSGNSYPATTSPVAVAAMIALLKEKGARRVVIGDMSGIEHVKLSPDGLSGSSRSLMEASGMARAALAAGAELHFFEEAGWKSFYEDAPTVSSHWKRPLMMPNILKEVQHIVLMPRCGRHALAGSSLGLKAAVGYWRTDTRLEYHRIASSLQEKTAEANTVDTLKKKQRLVVSAADKVLTTYGPDNGYALQPEAGLVIASESVLAHDMVSLAWLLECRRTMKPPAGASLTDPYEHQFIVGLANRYIVGKLGGLWKAFGAETLVRNDIKAIWDDRILNHAYQVFGGVPGVILEKANDIFPEDIRKRLAQLTSRSG